MILEKVKNNVKEFTDLVAQQVVKGLEEQGFTEKEEQLEQINILSSTKFMLANVIQNTAIAAGIKTLGEKLVNKGKNSKTGTAYVITTAGVAVIDSLLRKKVLKRAEEIIKESK